MLSYHIAFSLWKEHSTEYRTNTQKSENNNTKETNGIFRVTRDSVSGQM